MSPRGSHHSPHFMKCKHMDYGSYSVYTNCSCSLLMAPISFVAAFHRQCVPIYWIKLTISALTKCIQLILPRHPSIVPSMCLRSYRQNTCLFYLTKKINSFLNGNYQWNSFKCCLRWKQNNQTENAVNCVHIAGLRQYLLHRACIYLIQYIIIEQIRISINTVRWPRLS